MKNKYILSIFFSLFLLLTAIGCSIRSSAILTLSNWEIGHAFALRINDVIDSVYGNYDIDKLIDLQNKIGYEKSIYFVTDAYVQETIINVLKNNENAYDSNFINETKQIYYVNSIKNETLKLISNELDDSWKTNELFENDLSDAISDALDALAAYSTGIKNSLNQHKLITWIYFSLTGTKFIVSYTIISIILLVFIYRLDNSYSTIKKCFITTGIINLLVGICFKHISWTLSNRFLGRTIDFMINPFFIMTLFILLLFCIVILIEKRKERLNQ